MSTSGRRSKLGLVLGLSAAGAWLTATPAVAQHGEAAHEAGHEAGHEASAAHEGEAAEHGEGHEPHWNYFQFAGQLTNFAIWLVLLYMLLNRILPKYLADRRASVVDGLEEAKRLKADAEAKFEEYSKRIDSMDDELARVRDDMKKAALDERDRLVKEAAEKAERMHAEARFVIQQQMKQLKEELTREAIESAVAAAEKILRDGTSPADQQRLADEYLARLKATASTTTDKGAAS